MFLTERSNGMPKKPMNLRKNGAVLVILTERSDGRISFIADF